MKRIILTIIFLICFFSIKQIYIDFEAYQDLSNNLTFITTSPNMESNHRDHELNKLTNDILSQTKINQKRYFPNLWANWYIEKGKALLIFLQRYEDYIQFEAENDVIQSITVCLMKARLGKKTDCLAMLLSDMNNKGSYNDLNFWTIYILVKGVPSDQELEKITDPKILERVENFLIPSSKDEILKHIFP